MVQIKSEIYKGEIYAGETDLASTIGYELNEPNQLVVKAGSLTLQGQTYEIDQTVFTFTENGNFQVCLGRLDGEESLAAYSPLNPPPNWEYIQQIAGFGSGIEVNDGAIVSDVYVLTVKPGFPPEQTQEGEFLLENSP